MVSLFEEEDGTLGPRGEEVATACLYAKEEWDFVAVGTSPSSSSFPPAVVSHNPYIRDSRGESGKSVEKEEEESGGPPRSPSPRLLDHGKRLGNAADDISPFFASLSKTTAGQKCGGGKKVRGVGGISCFVHNFCRTKKKRWEKAAAERRARKRRQTFILAAGEEMKNNNFSHRGGRRSVGVVGLCLKYITYSDKSRPDLGQAKLCS